jgi:hypothetical protein
MGSEAKNARMVSKAKPDVTTASAAKSQMAGRILQTGTAATGEIRERRGCQAAA